MNLRDKFSKADKESILTQTLGVKCEKIADDYAIEFIEWCGLRTVQITKSEWSNWLPNADGSLSTKELLQIFKNEKKL
jgi:hypothetical protein